MVTTEKAILAGGCFWGMQDVIKKREPTPKRSRSSSIRKSSPTEACSSSSSRSMTPTTVNRQGEHEGTLYRSAIFCCDEQRRRVAEDTIADVDASGLWPGKVVDSCHVPGPGWVLPHGSDAVAAT